MVNIADVFAVEWRLVPEHLRTSEVNANNDIALLYGDPPVVCAIAKRTTHGGYWVRQVIGRNLEYGWYSDSLDFFKIVVILMSDKGMAPAVVLKNVIRMDFTFDWEFYPAGHTHADPVTRNIAMPVAEFLDGASAAYIGDNNKVARDLLLFTLKRHAMGSEGHTAVIGFRNWLCWRSRSGTVDFIERYMPYDPQEMQKSVDALYALLTS